MNVGRSIITTHYTFYVDKQEGNQIQNLELFIRRYKKKVDNFREELQLGKINVCKQINNFAHVVNCVFFFADRQAFFIDFC